MFNNLDSSITSISEEQLDELFGETPDNEMNADKLLGGKADKAKDKPKVVTGEDKVIVGGNSFANNIDHVDDIDALLDEDEEDKDDEKEKEDKKDIKKDKSSNKEDKKDSKETDNPIEDGDDVDKDTPESDETVKGVLKNTVDFLVDKGLWLDFDGREDLEIDAKTYAELTAKQDEARVNRMFSELVDSTGDYGKAIINFVKNGGNPDEVIDLFKEQKQIETFDIKNEDGRKQLISKYYKDILNWKPERIDRHISGLLSKDELETEAEEVKELYEQHTQEELDKINRAQEQYLQQQEQKEKQFKDNITSALNTRKDLNEREKKFLEQSILHHKNKLPNGSVVSDFYVKFAEMQADPQEYIDFVNFVMNKEGYLNKIKKDITNKAVDKTFNFVKGNTAVGNKKGSSYDNVKRQQKSIEEFTFGLPKR